GSYTRARAHIRESRISAEPAGVIQLFGYPAEVIGGNAKGVGDFGKVAKTGAARPIQPTACCGLCDAHMTSKIGCCNTLWTHGGREPCCEITVKEEEKEGTSLPDTRQALR
ncbi:MAG: hypothetical protein VB060_00005, partial [Oscillibacter sp.]